MGAMGVIMIIPSEGTVERVSFDSLSAAGSPGLRPAGGGFVGQIGPQREIQSGLRAAKGWKYALRRARAGEEALRGFHRFAPLETCEMVTMSHAKVGQGNPN